MRGAVFIGPVIAFIITRRWCISLQRHDNEKLLHGYESGVIMRDAQGGYTEKHLPLPVEQAYTLTARDRDEVFVPESGGRQQRGRLPHGAQGQGPGPALAALVRRQPCRSRPWPSSTRPTTTPRIEHAHDVALEGHAADGHQFDGRHDVTGEELASTEHERTTQQGPGLVPGPASSPTLSSVELVEPRRPWIVHAGPSRIVV